MKQPIKVVVPSAIVGLSSIALAAGSMGVAYPEGYRAWRHVKTMVISQGHPLNDAFGGIHHLYANPKALAGYKSGKFADGAVIVFDLLAVDTANSATTEGARKVVGVMHRDAKKFAATGGWGFEGFAGDSKTQRVVGDAAKTACFDCHTARVQHNYVFSEYRD
jgi:hypothetical protein